MKKLSLVLTMLFLIVSTGLAQKGDAGDFKKTIDLQPTELGKQFDVQGRAVIGQRNGVQVFGVRVSAEVKDGTLYQVLVTTTDGTLGVGTITISLGSGQLLLQSSSDGVSAAFPVNAIQAVTVRDFDGVVLEGTF